MAQKVTPTKTFYRDLGNLCRLCGNEPLYTINIFSKSGQKNQLRDKIIKSTGLCVQNDGSSDVVCRKCERTLDKIIQFQEKVIQTQKVFEQKSFFKRVIEMSPSRGSLRKKHVSMPATPTKIASKRLTFDKTDVEDTLQTQPQSIDLEMQPLCTTTEDVLTNQLPRFKKFVSVHRHNIAPSTVSIQISKQVEQPASVKSKSTDVYLSKQLNPSEIAALERSVATKEPTAVAHIVMVKTPVVLYAVKREIVNSLSESCKKNLCRRTNGSVLYKKDYNEMSEFEFDNVWKEIVKFAPFFIDILNAVAGEMCDLADTPASLRVKYCLVYSILMNQRWHELSLLQRINTVLMIRGGSSKQVILFRVH